MVWKKISVVNHVKFKKKAWILNDSMRALWREHSKTLTRRITYIKRAQAARSETLPKLLLKLQWAVDNINNQANNDEILKLNEGVCYVLLDATCLKG